MKARMFPLADRRRILKVFKPFSHLRPGGTRGLSPGAPWRSHRANV